MKTIPSLTVIEGGVRGPKYRKRKKHVAGSTPVHRNKGMTCPDYLDAKARTIWKRLIAPAAWLDSFDEGLAVVVAIELARYLANPPAVKSSRLAVVRLMMRDLGLAGPRSRRGLADEAYLNNAS